MREALYWEPISAPSSSGSAGRVRCLLCPHRCAIPPDGRGKCHARVNRGGKLYSETWGIISSLALDPVEKKPFARFHSGSNILSAGSYGCNLSCLFCQNHGISQRGANPFSHGDDPAIRVVEPKALVAEAIALRNEGNIGIAFTYNEPLVGYEFVLDTALLAKEAGLKTALVTNGFVNPEPLERLLPFIDAMNIDVKAFTETYYHEICGGFLEPVLATVAYAASRCHVELTTLVLPGENSSLEEIDELARWVASVDSRIALHLNRHHPDYLMPSPPPIGREALYQLAAEARKHLAHVFVGNA